MNVYIVIMQDEIKRIVQERVPSDKLSKFIYDTQLLGGLKIITIVLIP